MEAECFLVRRFLHAPAAPIFQKSLFSNSIMIKNKNGSLKVATNKSFHEADGHDHEHPFFKSAISRASYRFQETLRPDPLFIDSYAGCFTFPDLEIDEKSEHKLLSYCLATRFIDDELLNATKGDDGAKQVVLFTDGMDTRAYRLSWPPSTIIYDVSPQAVFNEASLKLQDVGAKIPRRCLLLHVPLESSDMQQLLRDKGFNGSRPSVWVFQGFPVTDLAGFKEILFMVGSLAMKGCLLLGEFPVWLSKTEEGTEATIEKWMYNLFMSYGFRVRIIRYDDVARNHGRELLVEDKENLLFVAEHIRFSDDQMETWRAEFQRVEEEGDEEGFEEL